MYKRCLAALICFLLLLTQFSTVSFAKSIAQPLNDTGNTRYYFSSGDGSADNPYHVSTAEALNAVRNDLSAHYIQTADIDLSGVNWIPIGFGCGGYSYRPGIGTPSFENVPFEGSYDGNNFMILNVSIQTSEFDTVGLFGYCSEDSTVKNV